MLQIRQALLAAADNALVEGTITQEDYDAVVKVARHPLRLFKVRKYIISQARRASLLTEDSENQPEAIDWQNLLDFITKLMPLILQLIALFG
jgi:hypothetical protein